MRNAYIMTLQGSRIKNLLAAALLLSAMSACANAPSNSSGIGHVPPAPGVQSNPGDIFNMNGNLIY